MYYTGKFMQICVLILLVIGILCGCGSNTKTIEPQYPLHYEKVYESLYGADIQEATKALGYTLEQLEHDPIRGYILPDKTSFLGYDFMPSLVSINSNGANALVCLCYYLELDAQTGGKTIEDIGETLQKMFGYRYRSKYTESEGFRDLDSNELTAKLNGTESWTNTMKWLLTEDIGHLPQMKNRTGITLAFKAVHDPDSSVSYIMLTYQYDVVGGNVLVR